MMSKLIISLMILFIIVRSARITPPKKTPTKTPAQLTEQVE